MLLPVSRGVRFAEMELLHEALPASGHAVKKYKWINELGQVIEGVFKPLDPHYPPLLAKFSVAISVWLRMALGEQAAEERLVFNDDAQLMGSVSIYLTGFVPFLGFGEPAPTDPDVLALANPSLETLLAHRVSTILVAGMLAKCDDRHPGNFGLRYNKLNDQRDSLIIDFDMCFYPYTSHMKGGRAGYDGIVRTISSKTMQLIKSYLDNFPDIEQRVHWPTNLLPSNLNPFKRYQSREAFKLLTGNALFHEQTSERLLIHLLTFDPIVLQARLRLYLGDLRLYFSALEPLARQGLSDNYPELFNPQTDNEPCREVLMRLFQQEHDELYREVVYYEGCKQNSAGSSIESFNQFLQTHRSLLKDALNWVGTQNVSWLGESPAAQLDIDRLEARYHEILRDSYRPQIQSLILHFRELKRTIAEGSWQLADNLASSVMERSAQEVFDQQIIPGLSLLDRYIARLIQITQNYLSLSTTSLVSESNEFLKANQRWLHAVMELLTKDSTIIVSALKDSPIWQQSFLSANQLLQNLVQSFNWVSYRDSSVPGITVNIPKIDRAWNDPVVIQEFLSALFDWAALPSSMSKLLQCIELAIKEYLPYSLNPLANRTRNEEVLPYLGRVLNQKETADDHAGLVNGANILAYIISTDGLESNSLNTLIIRQLLPKILEDLKGRIEFAFQCIDEAFRSGILDPVLYTKAANQYAKIDVRFTHIYTRRAETCFNDAMYRWVNLLPHSEFKDLVLEALKLYEPVGNLYRLFVSSRGPKVREYLAASNYTNAQILGLIFKDGGIEPGYFTVAPLNVSLFKIIFKAMQAGVHGKVKTGDDEGFLMIEKMEEAEALKYLASASFKQFASKQAEMEASKEGVFPQAAAMYTHSN